jgi:Domain of unknown function (DUF5666)
MHRVSIIAALLVSATLGWAQAATDHSADQAPGGWQHRRGERGPGVAGTITAIDNGKFTVKTPDGQTAQLGITDQTQFRRDREPAKLADFKVGDQIFVRGQQKDGVWQAQMIAARTGGGPGGDFREGMGKNFIAGEVKAINGTQLTILRPDGQTQDITVDESTSFHKDRDSITLADIKVGDHVFGRGEIKNDVFVPSALNLGQPPTMGRPRDGAPAPN